MAILLYVVDVVGGDERRDHKCGVP